MSQPFKKSTEFLVKELSIITKDGLIDITSIYQEINIFDSLLSPVMTGSILLTDATGLSNRFLFDGSESILIHIIKSSNLEDTAFFKKAFRIYKQSDRKNKGLNSEFYVLHFCSDELMYSDQQRINQSYENTYGKIVSKILVDYLRVSENRLKGIFEDTFGIKQIVIPNLKPIDAISWCAKRSVDYNKSPNYVFFENAVGFNYVTLSKLLTQDTILNIQFGAKNLKSQAALDEISMARGFEVIVQNDSLARQRSGVNAGQFIGFDPITRTTAIRQIGYGDVYSSMKHSNSTENTSIVQNKAGIENVKAYNSKKTYSMFGAAQQYSEYIKKNDPESLSKIENLEDWVFQRKSIFENLMSKRIKIVMPGNFQLSSGFNVKVDAPNFGKKIKGGGDDNEDTSLNGNYIIVASRHIIGYDKHETIIEVATTSTNSPVSTSNYIQTEEMETYG